MQAAIGWIQEVPQLHFLLEKELLPIQEDLQMARTCVERIAATSVEPWDVAGEVEVPTVIGEHTFTLRSSGSSLARLSSGAPELGLNVCP